MYSKLLLLLFQFLFQMVRLNQYSFNRLYYIFYTILFIFIFSPRIIISLGFVKYVNRSIYIVTRAPVYILLCTTCIAVSHDRSMWVTNIHANAYVKCKRINGHYNKLLSFLSVRHGIWKNVQVHRSPNIFSEVTVRCIPFECISISIGKFNSKLKKENITVIIHLNHRSDLSVYRVEIERKFALSKTKNTRLESMRIQYTAEICKQMNKNYIIYNL